ncbi:MAG: hypothetical protein IPL88_14095 [Rhizobiales bacterium]|nr:hypothetical protein [Hyphomicrobiales bacterium]
MRIMRRVLTGRILLRRIVVGGDVGAQGRASPGGGLVGRRGGPRARRLAQPVDADEALGMHHAEASEAAEPAARVEHRRARQVDRRSQRLARHGPDQPHGGPCGAARQRGAEGAACVEPMLDRHLVDAAAENGGGRANSGGEFGAEGDEAAIGVGLPDEAGGAPRGAALRTRILGGQRRRFQRRRRQRRRGVGRLRLGRGRRIRRLRRGVLARGRDACGRTLRCRRAGHGDEQHRRAVDQDAADGHDNRLGRGAREKAQPLETRRAARRQRARERAQPRAGGLRRLEESAERRRGPDAEDARRRLARPDETRRTTGQDHAGALRAGGPHGGVGRDGGGADVRVGRRVVHRKSQETAGFRPLMPNETLTAFFRLRPRVVPSRRDS